MPTVEDAKAEACLIVDAVHHFDGLERLIIIAVGLDAVIAETHSTVEAGIDIASTSATATINTRETRSRLCTPYPLPSFPAYRTRALPIRVRR